jgi:hypothetical protein
MRSITCLNRRSVTSWRIAGGAWADSARSQATTISCWAPVTRSRRKVRTSHPRSGVRSTARAQASARASVTAWFCRSPSSGTDASDSSLRSKLTRDLRRMIVSGSRRCSTPWTTNRGAEQGSERSTLTRRRAVRSSRNDTDSTRRWTQTGLDSTRPSSRRPQSPQRRASSSASSGGSAAASGRTVTTWRHAAGCPAAPCGGWSACIMPTRRRGGRRLIRRRRPCRRAPTGSAPPRRRAGAACGPRTRRGSGGRRRAAPSRWRPTVPGARG